MSPQQLTELNKIALRALQRKHLSGTLSDELVQEYNGYFGRIFTSINMDFFEGTRAEDFLDELIKFSADEPFEELPIAGSSPEKRYIAVPIHPKKKRYELAAIRNDYVLTVGDNPAGYIQDIKLTQERALFLNKSLNYPYSVIPRELAIREGYKPVIDTHQLPIQLKIAKLVEKHQIRTAKRVDLTITRI